MTENLLTCKCDNSEFYILVNPKGVVWFVCTKCENRAKFEDLFTIK